MNMPSSNSCDVLKSDLVMGLDVSNALMFSLDCPMFSCKLIIILPRSLIFLFSSVMLLVVSLSCIGLCPVSEVLDLAAVPAYVFCRLMWELFSVSFFRTVQFL